jgi:Rho GDP-dissociation inhibitor
MAEQPNADPQVEVEDETEDTPGYKAPAMKTLDEIKNLDKDDESLIKYKQQLLQGAEDVLCKCPSISQVMLFIHR